VRYGFILCNFEIYVEIVKTFSVFGADWTLQIFHKILDQVKMDYIKAKNTEDAVILGLIVTAAVFLSQTLNNTAMAIFKTLSPKHQVRDWIIFSIIVLFLFVVFIYILRMLYFGAQTLPKDEPIYDI
jgi:ABC-type maltose transport system permease subunit